MRGHCRCDAPLRPQSVQPGGLEPSLVHSSWRNNGALKCIGGADAAREAAISTRGIFPPSCSRVCVIRTSRCNIGERRVIEKNAHQLVRKQLLPRLSEPLFAVPASSRTRKEATWRREDDNASGSSGMLDLIDGLT